MDVQSRVQEMADGLVASGAEVGLQISAYLHGEPVVDVHAGRADTSTGRPVDDRTLFPAAGVNLVSTVVHVLAERGLIEYGVPVAAYWPEFGAHGKTDITVAHVLTHSSGVPQAPDGLVFDDLADWDGTCARIADLRPLWRAGAATGQHSLTFGYILGEVARRVTGRPLPEILRNEVAEPLGVPEDLFIGVPARHLPRVARLEEEEERDPLLEFPAGSLFHRVIPHAFQDEDAAMMNRADRLTMDAPYRGMMTAHALARMYAALIGDVDGVRLISPARTARLSAIVTMKEDRVFGWAMAKGLGYFVAAASMGSASAFGCSAAGGLAFADPERGLAFAYLPNLQIYGLDSRAYEVADGLRLALGLETGMGQAIRRRRVDREMRRTRRRVGRRRRRGRGWTPAG
ncbi:serine hydrolase domain-containing protein [Spirillospora sp. NPDC047418]